MTGCTGMHGQGPKCTTRVPGWCGLITGAHQGCEQKRGVKVRLAPAGWGLRAEISHGQRAGLGGLSSEHPWLLLLFKAFLSSL